MKLSGPGGSQMATLLEHPVPTLPPPPKSPPPSRRKWLPNWSRRTWQVLAIVATVLFLGSVWLFYISSVFALQSLVIEGVRTVDPKDIGQRADLGAGTPLARVDADDVEARVMGIPAISSVSVSRRWPNMIVISVVERSRVAVMQQEDGRWATLDAGGYPFEFTKKKPQGLPVIEAPEGPARTAAIAVASALPPELASKVKLVSADDPDKVVLKTSSGATVAWGKSDQNELKARILLALLAKTKDGWIDLRVPTTPTSAQSSPRPRVPTPTPSAGEIGPDGLPIAPSMGTEGTGSEGIGSEGMATSGEVSVPTPSANSGMAPSASPIR